MGAARRRQPSSGAAVRRVPGDPAGPEIRVGEHIHTARARLSLTPDSTHIVITNEGDELMVEMRYQQGRLQVRRTRGCRRRYPPTI